MSDRHDLPPGLARDASDPGDDPVAAEARGQRMLAEAGAGIVAGVARLVPAWAVGQVERILDAWGRADAPTRERAAADAAEAGRAAATRLRAELEALLAQDPAAQGRTPVEVVATAYREPTAVLAAAGVPEVVRDPFDERTWPDDRYGLAPRTLGDLGDPDLGALQLAWGLGKATVLRARIARRGAPGRP